MKTRSGLNYRGLGKQALVHYGAIAADRAVRAAGRYAVNKATKLLTGTRQGASEYAINTTQHDLVTRYRKRRMPRRRRKRWVGFVKRVQSVIAKAQPLQSYNNLYYANGTSSANKGGYWGWIMGGTQPSANDELLRCFYALYNKSAITDIYNYKILMKSICMDVMFTNTGAATIIVDVYRLACKNSYQSASSLATQFAANVGDIAASPGAGANTIAASDLGITLFDVPNFCKNWRIINKKELVISAGQTSTFQMRNSRKKLISGRDLQSYPQAIPGYSQAYFFTWHGIPSNNGGTAEFAATTITIGVAISAKYGQPPGSQQQEAAQSDE